MSPRDRLFLVSGFEADLSRLYFKNLYPQAKMLHGREIFRQMRQIFAGILCLWQENLTKYGGKDPPRRHIECCEYRFSYKGGGFALDFAQFCSSGPYGYACLKQRVDACAGLGRSYEFNPCRMPAFCRPREAQIGFWRHGDDYLLYFRPVVVYDGPDRRLRDFFSRGAVQRYPDFDALASCLRGLDGEVAAPLPDASLYPRLQQELEAQILGQRLAVEAAAFKLRCHVCKREPLRPLSLIFYGPTGVGKSELAKAIAPALNRCLGEDRFRPVWTELNTFTQAHSVYRLTGAPPGYVGYDDPPVLEAVRRCPHTVFMFDELDKAHPEVLKVLMSVLDEGRCTARREDAQGSRELDFRRCIFLFTTNIDLSGDARPGLGFAPPQKRREPLPDRPVSLAQRLFWADEAARQALVRSGVLREIAGRFNGLISFRPLDREARVAVTVRQITALGREYGLHITQVDPALAQALTPRDALSPRSSLPMLEGLLTPVFLSRAVSPGQSTLRLSGPPERPVLFPA